MYRFLLSVVCLTALLAGCDVQRPTTPAGTAAGFSTAQFNAAVIEKKLPAMIDFSATWCPPCREMAPIVADLSKQYENRVVVASINVDANKDLAGRYGINSIPAFLFFYEGQEVHRIIGSVSREELERHLEELAARHAAAQPATTQPPTASEPSAMNSPPPAETQPIVAPLPPGETAETPPTDPSPEKSPAAEEELRRAGQLVADDAAVRREASDYFDSLGPQAVPRLIGILHDGPPEARRGAAFGLLGRFDPRNETMMNAFLAALDDDDRATRQVALQGVTQMPDEQVLPHTDRLVKIAGGDEDPALRLQAIQRLGRLGNGAAPILPALIERLPVEEAPSAKIALILALGKIGDGEPGAVAAVQQVLGAEVAPEVRRAAARQLAKWGPRSAPAVAALAAALDDSDATVRAAAADALAAIGPEALDALIERLDDQNRETRVLAIYAVGVMGPPAARAADVVRPLLQDSDTAVRRVAELTLQRIGAAP